MGTKKGRLQIYIVDEIPVLLFDIQWVEFRKTRGVVDDPVEPSKMIGDAIDHRTNFTHTLQIRAKDGGVSAFGGGGSRAAAGKRS